MACSYLRGGGVPTLISGHIAVRDCHYVIFIKTWWLFLPPPPPPLLLAFPLPSLTNFIISFSNQRKVYGEPGGLNSANARSNTVHVEIYYSTLGVEAGDVLLNQIQQKFCQCLSNGRVLPVAVLALRHPTRNPPRLPMM